MNPVMITAALLSLSSVVAANDLVEIQVHPTKALIERTRLGQAVNFDFELVNRGNHTLRLDAIRAAVRDKAGLIVERLEINDNGGLPSIDTVTARTWKPGEGHTIFNPFHTLAADIPIGRIDFEFRFKDESGREITRSATVQPVAYRQKTALILPLRGRVLVWDGHDFYAHHRRWDFSNPALKKLGVFSNSSRYALDLVIVGPDGTPYKDLGDHPQDYFGYRATVIAPAPGKVVAMANEAADEPAEASIERIKANPLKAVYGNFVVIDHGNGEFSQMGHMLRGSVKVHVGDWVRQGQPLGQVGESGTSLFPHLHYQLVAGAGIDTEGLPARFNGIVRVLGSQRKREQNSPLDSGDIVQTAP